MTATMEDRRLSGRIRTRMSELAERLKDDRGSLSMAVVIWTPIVVTLCAFVVNVGFLISDREKANDLAEQAARRVADQLDKNLLYGGTGVLRVDVDQATGDCVALANTYFADNQDTDQQVASAHVDACTVTNNPDPATGVKQNPNQPTVVTVTVTLKHTTIIPGFGIADPQTIQATGSASPQRVT